MSVFWFRTILLALIFTVAVVCDWRTRRIPGTVLTVAAITGLCYRLICNLPLLPALLTAALLLLIGLLCYAWRILGGGDGKLLALTGLYYGWPTWQSYGGYLLIATVLIGGLYLALCGRGMEKVKGVVDYFETCLTTKRLLPYPRTKQERGFPFTICLAAAFVLHTGRGVLLWLGSAYIWRI